MTRVDQTARSFRFGPFEADLRELELRKRGLKLKLQGQPFQVLAILLQRTGELVTRDELRQALWPADTFVDFDHSLNTAINKIREALGDSASNSQYVETVPKRGYRFIASVGVISTDAHVQTSTPPVKESAEKSPSAANASAHTQEADLRAISPEALNQLPAAPRGVARFFFALIQIMYLAFYLSALARLERIHQIVDSLSPGAAPAVQIAVLITAVLAIPTRLYLFSAVSFDYRGLGIKFRRLFLALAVADEFWALAPFLMIPVLGVGLAFAATAALLYVPFAQRTLMRMAYAEKTASKPVSGESKSDRISKEKVMVRATWEGKILAESNDCAVVEGNQYFPADAIKKEHFKPSQYTSQCPWKGTAHYYDVVVDGKTNTNAAWYYPQPYAAAIEIKDRVAFWKGVKVET